MSNASTSTKNAAEKSLENGVESVIENVKGKAKELFGTFTGNDDLRDEGAAQQDKADEMSDVADKQASVADAKDDMEKAEARQKLNQ